jgi:hypothetical protein
VTVDVADARWWTFGFESFGQQHAVRDHLRSVAEEWFRRRGEPRDFYVAQSVAYPAWAGGFV